MLLELIKAVLVNIHDYHDTEFIPISSHIFAGKNLFPITPDSKCIVYIAFRW